jgi:putative membrane protein
VGPSADKPYDLGYDRTRISADRTLMAWIRTSVSMISFGFTIYKFFMYLQESNVLSEKLPMYGPRNLGLGLVGLGTFLMMLAILEHFLYQRSLSKRMGQPFRLSTALIASLLITLIGLLALLNLLFNVGPI